MQRSDQTRHRLSDVFGIQRDVPLNYVERKLVDGEFIESLTRDKHIVIHGSSKQGKTSLRKSALPDTDVIKVSCQKGWGLKNLHEAILKAAGFTVVQSSSKTVGGTRKISAAFGAAMYFLKTNITGERTKSTEEAEVRAPLELDPLDPNDIISALAQIDFDRSIVLEDFHYLSDRVQSEFSTVLKTYHEESALIFIIVGVWIDENRLVSHNGDLAARVTTINADKWTRSELMRVVEAGERLLNIRLSTYFKNELVDECSDTVWLVQEICFLACRDAGVIHTYDRVTDVHPAIRAKQYAHQVALSQSARYQRFLDTFPLGPKSSELELYRWTLLPVIAVDPNRLEKGLDTRFVRTLINKYHPKGSIPDVTFWNTFQGMTGLQVDKNIAPVILDHDASGARIFVVDRGFLIWLRHQDRFSLLQNLGLPQIYVDHNDDVTFHGR